MILELKCRFCGIKTGELKIEDTENPPKIEELFIDIRCSIDQAQFGTFQELETKYRAAGKNNYEEFLEIAEKSNFKNTEFQEELTKL